MSSSVPIRALSAILFVIMGGSCARENEVARVGGRCLTEGEQARRAGNIVALYRHRMGSRADTNQLARIRETFVRGYARVWVEDRVLEDYAVAEGIKVSDDLTKKLQNGAFANFRATGDRKYGDLLKIEGLDVALWNDQVRSEALRSVVKDHWTKLYPTNIPDSHVEHVIASIRRHNEDMALTNAVQYAKATNVWEKLKAGADFVKMAKENTELDEEAQDDGEWAVVDAKFLSDEPVLLKWLQGAAPGMISPPIAADNGVMIARLDRLENEGGFAVSRIFFHLGQVYEPAPKDQIVGKALADYAKGLFKSRLDELVKASGAKIFSEYNGKDRK